MEILFRAMTKVDGNVKDSHQVEGYYVKFLTRTPYPIVEDQNEADKFYQENTRHLIVFATSNDWGLPQKLMQVDIIPETLEIFMGQYDDSGQRLFIHVYPNTLPSIDIYGKRR